MFNNIINIFLCITSTIILIKTLSFCKYEFNNKNKYGAIVCCFTAFAGILILFYAIFIK